MASYWTPKDYTPFYLMDEPTHTPAEIRREYSRVRDIIMKRANRLDEAGLGYIAHYLRQSVPKLSDIKDIGRMIKGTVIASKLANAHSILNTSAYSLKGIKQIQKRYIAELHGESISIGDVLPFAEYMQSWRQSAFSSMIAPSGEAAELYNEDYQEIGGSFANFYTLYQHGV